MARSDRALYVGLGVGRTPFRSGMPCFENSDAAWTGNCSSENVVPNVEPKRKMVQARSSVNRNMLGCVLDWQVPARTSWKTAWSNPDLAGETVSTEEAG